MIYKIEEFARVTISTTVNASPGTTIGYYFGWRSLTRGSGLLEQLRCKGSCDFKYTNLVDSVGEALGATAF